MMLDAARPFLISPPFGTYFRSKLAYSVLGSFTVDRRDRETTGESRLQRVAKSVRPVEGGWVNKVGLRNPGLQRSSLLPSPDHRFILSIAALVGNDREWTQITSFLIARKRAWGRRFGIELNISCPNTDHLPAMPSKGHLRTLIELEGFSPIFKLQPLPSSVDAAVSLADSGARYLHLSNTVPTPIGGISGAALREVNLPLIETVANRLAQARHNEVTIIAGGGIYDADHVRQYIAAGALRFSLATVFFRPWRAYQLIRETASSLSFPLVEVES